MNPEERRFYLKHVPIQDAMARLKTALAAIGKERPLKTELLPLEESLGRITAEAIWAKISVPHYHAAAMDGVAVKSEETVSAIETQALRLYPSQYQAVNTGAPLPENFNAVIMIEHIQELEDGILITAPVAPWQHVRMMGEDMIATELLLPAHHKLRPVDLGAIAACGHHQVRVFAKPKVVLIPTGSELVTPQSLPDKGQTIEFNSLILRGQLEEAGTSVITFGIQADEESQLTSSLEQAIATQPDLILVLSGSSAGSKDYTANLVENYGELLVHGVAVRPGHPVIMGIVSEIPIFGVPGYPVSAALTTELFIEPLLAEWLGQKAAIEKRPRTQAVVSRKLLSPIGDDEYVRVSLSQLDGKIIANPLQRGAGVITSLMRADGLLHVPRFVEGYEKGQVVDVILYRPLEEIQKSILMMGSHDPMLDMLAQFIAAKHDSIRLTSINLGSLGGIIALKRGEAHLAGVHLLDAESGQYNIPQIQQYLPSLSLELVTFAHREQGLIVPKGNPKRIQSIDDLPQFRYVNRQKGAGTRLLLDYELAQRGISSESIHGYEHEEYTHLAVAVAVASGIADCGMGVRRAAIALDLDFIPITWERYDLIIPQAYRDFLSPLLETIHSENFQQVLSQEAGYSNHETGKVQYLQQ